MSSNASAHFQRDLKSTYKEIALAEYNDANRKPIFIAIFFNTKTFINGFVFSMILVVVDSICRSGVVKISKKDSVKQTSDKDSAELEEIELKERLYNMEVMIKKLEWDESRNQINPAKKVYLDDLRKELKEKCVKINFDD